MHISHINRYIVIFFVVSTLFGDNGQSGIYTIDKRVQKRMLAGGSYKKECPVKLTSLRYLVLPFWGYDKKKHQGELIVHQDVAQEVVMIFEELFRKRFPIERMELISNFNADDEVSMSLNNTSAFNCRFIANTTKYSKHSFGKAIDINPKINPCIIGDDVYPKNGVFFTDRSKGELGMIKEDSLPVSLFESYGWKWGGEWKSLKDYQHFEKR